jgi:hypothetical protein
MHLRTALRIHQRIALRTVLRIHLRTATIRTRISKLKKIRIPFGGYPYLHNGKYRVYCCGNLNLCERNSVEYEKV